MDRAHEVLIQNLREHSRLDDEDVAQVYALSCTIRLFEPNEDFIRQGDDPKVAAFEVYGWLGAVQESLVRALDR